MMTCWIFVAMVMISVSQACDVPPSFWCSSEEVARHCGVQEQCKGYFSKSKAEAGPVNVTLYYESQCQACRIFITEQLYKVFQTLGTEVINVTLVPYGNAKEKKDIFGHWKFTCQHGPEECVGNFIESCAIVLMKDISKFFPFINCMESLENKEEKDAMKCASKLKITIDPILTCANGSMGAEVEHTMAEITGALNPPHTYVPWITINGVHTEELQNKAQSHLLQVVCDTYKGKTPKACEKVTGSQKCLKQ